MSHELGYIGLILLLFVVPKTLQRFAIPGALTSFGLGAGAALGLDLFVHDATVGMMATLGIVSLFLFAGLEVDKDDLRRDARVLLQHLIIRAVLLLVATAAAWLTLDLDWRPATLVALALFTPSTGFILNSIGRMDLGEEQRRWIKSKAIASELLALGVLFVVLQSTSAARMGVATASLLGVVLVLPAMFRVFARFIVPHAPRSEVSFLVIIAIVCAYLTKQLGVYYLVGAFVVGVAAQRVREEVPALSSEKALEAVEVFASFFVPLYFFRAGSHLDSEALSPRALAIGSVFLAVALPMRIATVVAHRHLALAEPRSASVRIGVALCPTLVFTLVLAEILSDQFAAPPWLFGALTLYTVVNTLIPGIVLRLPPPQYDSPEAPDLEPHELDRMR